MTKKTLLHHTDERGRVEILLENTRDIKTLGQRGVLRLICQSPPEQTVDITAMLDFGGKTGTLSKKSITPAEWLGSILMLMAAFCKGVQGNR